MGGQAAEQIIAGVVLSERLAVTMYGAIHRAQWSGQRNLRGLVIEPKLLAEGSFRIALTDSKGIAAAIELAHPNIVPTVAVESGGPDVVVVTRGVGRYVTVQDLISAARANRKESGKLPVAVAAAIGKSVVEALATAHRAGIVHGAVHPRSVLVDEDGAVKLGDFVVGRALTTAVAQGADSSLWRGLAGYLAPELVVGEDPTPECDVYAVGAMLFTMLSGEVPPGSLHVTPAVERLVQRALDTDLVRRYKSAADLLENLLEAFEDDRWEIADRGEVIKAAGLSTTDTNIDDATEDLLASLGSSPGAVQVTPIRPSMDMRAEAVAARHTKQPTTSSNRLDALLADLDDGREHTHVEQMQFKRDPISELIQMDPRKREAIVQVRPRVPSLDDPDDETPIPPPTRESELDYMPGGSGRMRRSGSRDEASAYDALANLNNSNDERAAMDAVSGLGLDGPVRLASAADAAELAAVKLENAANRAEAAAARVETNHDAVIKATPAAPRPVVAARPIVDPIQDLELPPPRIKSRLRGILGLLVVVGLIGGVAYFIVENQREAKEEKKKRDDEAIKRQQEADEESRRRTEALGDSGSITVKSNPPQAGVWLKLGRSPFDSLPLSSGQMHELRIDGLPGYQAIDTQVIPSHWSGDKDKRGAKLVVQLKPIGKDAKGKPVAVALPPTPPEPPKPAEPFVPGRGAIHVETEPRNAEVWLYIGVTDNVRFNDLLAGRAYELRVVKDGYLPGFISISVDEWRDPKDDPKKPIDVAKKKQLLEKSVDLQPDPSAPKKKGS
ncbi:MAG: protein kinase [Kofleriaceae bacterium]